MQVPIIDGIYVDATGDFRTSLPRNLVPVPKSQGISQGYLRPAEGIVEFATGPGVDRGGILWSGLMYRVMGTKLVSIGADRVVVELGDVGAGGTVTMDYSFDMLGIWSGGSLFYWDGADLTQVIDPDLGTVIDGRWIAGYFASTDGVSIITTELNDPLAVNPLKYGSAESDPDAIKALDELRNELYAMGRYTIEVFRNVGGEFFPFQRIDGALVPRGVVGTHAYCQYRNTFAFLGSGRNEAPAVYLMLSGDTQKLSTREIDQILAGYSEPDLALSVVESRIQKQHQHLYIHLPDQTLVYDFAASVALDQPVWFTLASSLDGNSVYRARNFVWCYDQWISGDPTSSKVGMLSDVVSTHFDGVIGWEFGTQILYVEGNGAVVHEIEVVCLPGFVPLGADPVVWTSYSVNGTNWSQEKAKSAGKQGESTKRLAWRRQGQMAHWRIQKFRGTSDAHLCMARLEASIEPLITRPQNG